MAKIASDTEAGKRLAPRALSIDLEVGIKDRRIHKLAAVRGDGGEALTATGAKQVRDALQQLDAFAEGVRFLLGHNLVAFDLPHLRAARADLGILALPCVDTLRLNPLAFPKNPYHRLVKHYQDGQIQGGQRNNPELDARLVLELFSDQWAALRDLARADPVLVSGWHWLTTQEDPRRGMDSFFTTIRGTRRPGDEEAARAIRRFLDGRACVTHVHEMLANAHDQGWPFAFALAWLSVAGGNSVMPPWVLHQFTDAGRIVRALRDQPCGNPECAWCRERHDPRRELTRWFGFAEFRPEPADASGQPLQAEIVKAAMAREHLLGILPTGTGKSLCYQIPALSRFDKTGALTVVISPLVALMSDQVSGLEARGIGCCVTINGMLSMPERADALQRIRMGDAGIVIVSPEQLRNRTFRRALEQRAIGAWVLDEAHCLSKWGHDFRPDYRYIGRFIRERAGNHEIPPVMCLTATAKPDVVDDIVDHFRHHIGLELHVFDGGANRKNLDFSVIPTSREHKLPHIHEVLRQEMPEPVDGGAIVYCSTRRNTEEIADYLRNQGLVAAHFHAGMPPEARQDTQTRFIAGEIQVIAATNAFGMGIDKPDVRLVIHADIPGSLENYLQEAGRAGRDQRPAQCILMETEPDIERQFSMSARSRLTRREINAVLRSLRRLKRWKGAEEDIVATTGEILVEEDSGAFERDTATDDTRVRTAVAWLEETALLSREENYVQVFPSSLRIGSAAEAHRLIAKRIEHDDYRKQLMHIVDALLTADADEGISTDELMAASGLSSQGVRTALHDLESLGVASNDTALTAYMHVAVEDSSRRRLEQVVGLEKALIDEMVEHAPELTRGEASVLHLRHANQRLKDAGHEHSLPDKLHRLLKSLSADGRGEDGGGGSIGLRSFDAESVQVTLNREWAALRQTAELRRDAAAVLLAHLEGALPEGTRGKDKLAETTLGQLVAAVNGDIALQGRMKRPERLVDHALLWLHEQNVIRLNKGLAVFRPAMTIRLSAEKRRFNRTDFQPLSIHYQNQSTQIHIMAEYAQRGREKMAEALQLAFDYFRLRRDEFITHWMPGREPELKRQTTPTSWREIVESLRNRQQQEIVTDERQQTNVLILAGPGSGKTRVLVHRIAYLIRVQRERPQRILALAYNRHAAVEIRQRLHALVAEEASGVTILTCHALALRLTGESLFARRDVVDKDYFRDILARATSLLRGDGLPPGEADAQREQLLRGFRWILVDEYQDIGREQYELISALAGRTLEDADGKLSLFAVGDDDQNIYGFAGASVEFIRRFESDFSAKPAYLIENYRATRHLITMSNALIQPAQQRMKAKHPIVINAGRRNEPPGGRWEKLDPVGGGRVQCLPPVDDPRLQAVAVMNELERLAELDPDWEWTQTAVIAREWKFLDPVRAWCEHHGIPVQLARDEAAPFWRLRETQALIHWLETHGDDEPLIAASQVRTWLADKPGTHWWDVLREAIDGYALQVTEAEMPWKNLVEWLVEWGRELRRKQHGLLLLTAHRAKGLEFAHVAILDGNWDRHDRGEDPDAPRRLYYVAMTRAMETLTLGRLNSANPLIASLPALEALQIRDDALSGEPQPWLDREYTQLNPRDVDLSYAGRHAPRHPVHHALAALEPGDTLHLREVDGRWALFDDRDQQIGRMAQRFSIRPGRRPAEVRVAAVIVRRREGSDANYQRMLRCDHWEVALPEVVFLPE
ncbi:RecQ family ATP-dependent DNA helicase [Aquisalimonas sp.]|uniref:RecQ family ATP-dependent DNA helicase n=1 Tax=Aquisalimonas sp. TaxID=1872621 RepID=UPI0025C00B7C|nr:RecQ family ATP-dependent DNA helicase [Aquisalimonas sp.]